MAQRNTQSGTFTMVSNNVVTGDKHYTHYQVYGGTPKVCSKCGATIGFWQDRKGKWHPVTLEMTGAGWAYKSGNGNHGNFTRLHYSDCKIRQENHARETRAAEAKARSEKDDADRVERIIKSLEDDGPWGGWRHALIWLSPEMHFWLGYFGWKFDEEA